MEYEMSRRKLLHYIGALGSLSAYLREGRLFRVITGTPKDTQDGARVAPPRWSGPSGLYKQFFDKPAEFDFDLLARSYQELERRYKGQADRLGTPANDNPWYPKHPTDTT